MFSLYVHSLGKLSPWTFVFDNYNYARWTSVHHYDMEMLQESNSSIFQEFEANGNFVVSRIKNTFSFMGLDQCHEQLNKDVEGDDGMVDLTEDEDKLRHHTTFQHREDSDSFKARFSKHVSDLTTEFKHLSNPFLPDEATELIQLGIRDVMAPGVIKTVIKIEHLEISQHKEFRERRIIKKTKGLHDSITKNKLPLFKPTKTRRQSSSRTESKELKLHVRLFSQMYISTQIRGGNMDQFFSHETLKYPPVLTKYGEMSF